MRPNQEERRKRSVTTLNYTDRGKEIETVPDMHYDRPATIPTDNARTPEVPSTISENNHHVRRTVSEHHVRVNASDQVRLNMTQTDENGSKAAWSNSNLRQPSTFKQFREAFRNQMQRQKEFRQGLQTRITHAGENPYSNEEYDPKYNPVDYCLSSKGNKIVRSVIFIACTVICVFQLMNFLGFYFEFPTSVDVEVVRRRFIDFESVTICSARSFRKTQLCQLNRSLCLDKEFDFKNRDPEIVNLVSKNMRNFTLGIEEFLKECTMFTLYNKTAFTPLCQNNSQWVYDGYSSCWTIAPLIDSKSKDEYVFELDLDFQLGEYNFSSESTAGWVYFHSRFLVPDVERDISVSIPYLQVSRGFVEQIVVNYLEEPYKPTCRNLTKITDDEERATAERCYHQCLWETFNMSCGCIPSTISFIEPYKGCNMTEEDICSNDADVGLIRDECESACPVSCRITLYKLSIFRNDYERKDNTENLTVFNLDLRQVYHLEYNHKPQFTPIEVFSYVGGFLGIWLGISIPVAFDRFTFMVAFFHSIRKWKKHN